MSARRVVGMLPAITALLLALGSSALTTGCKGSPESAKPAPAPAASISSADDDSEPDVEDEEAPEATRPPRAAATVSNSAAAANDPVPAVDPARIPVAEDFVQEAESRITRRSNLEKELARIATEIQAH